jgi:tetratricopeptide (TPR) repeat protein
MKHTIFVLFLIAPAVAYAQDAAAVQKLFEAGQYQQVVQAARAEAPPAVRYTAAQSQQKLGATDQAREIYRSLADAPDQDPWHFVGLSGQQLLDDQVDAAVDSARQAVNLAGDLPEAQFQLGLALAKKQEWREAAAAFDRVADLNPSHAYAYYYGGLMHYRSNRPDQMAIHFDRFLKLAADAPERPEVLSIMRTVRGR